MFTVTSSLPSLFSRSFYPERLTVKIIHILMSRYVQVRLPQGCLQVHCGHGGNWTQNPFPLGVGAPWHPLRSPALHRATWRVTCRCDSSSDRGGDQGLPGLLAHRVPGVWLHLQAEAQHSAREVPGGARGVGQGREGEQGNHMEVVLILIRFAGSVSSFASLGFCKAKRQFWSLEGGITTNIYRQVLI